VGHYFLIRFIYEAIINDFKRSENKSYIIDAREAAPLNSHQDMFVNDSQKALIGGLATLV
jgi:gamma-glutamyltranspeptidase